MGQSQGVQTESTISVDDNSLPSPQELEAYQRINPDIVKFLMDTSVKEQAHRHSIEDEKMKLINYTEHRSMRMNWWGMFFAFVSLVVLVALSAFALYLDKPWFAGIFGFTAVVGIISTFVNAGKEQPKK